MKKQLSILISLLIFICFACKDDPTPLNNNSKIKIKLIDSDTIVFLPVDTIVSGVHYIPLETTKESFIGEINKVKIQDSLILAYNKDIDGLFIFDLSGKFLNKLTKSGRGHGEYMSIDDFNINKEQLLILDCQRKQLLYYSLKDLKFIGKKSTFDRYTHFTLLDNQILLHSNYKTCEKNYFNLIAADTSTLETIHQMMPYPEIHWGYAYQHDYLFYRHKDAVYATFPYNCSIYKYDKQKIQEILSADFLDKSLSESLRSGSRKELKSYLSPFTNPSIPVCEISNVIVSDTYYIFTFLYNCLTHTCYYNIADKTYTYGIMGASVKFPYFIQSLHGTFEDKVINIIEARFIQPLRPGAPNILASTNEDSNPVIALYEIK